MLHQLTDGCGLGHDEGQERRAFHHDGDVLADIAAAFTDFQLERAAFYIPPAAFGLPVCKGALVQREGDCCGLAGLQKNLLKSLQLPDGAAHRAFVIADIELYHDLAGARAGVGHVHLHLQHIRVAQLRLVRAKIAV